MKKNLILSSLFIAALLINVVPVRVYSQVVDECGKKTLTVIVRNGDGDFVPNIKFDLYRQIDDVDGRSKPGKKVASGAVSSVLGKGVLTFDDADGYEYALKVYDSSLSNADYYFYNDITLGCSATDEYTARVSSIRVSLYDADDELIKNKAFSIYTQRYDAAGEPIHEKEDLVGKFNTSAEGEATIYVPSSVDAIDGDGVGYYVLEFDGPDGGVFTVYDIDVSSGSVNNLEYVLSRVVLTFADEDGNNFPGNTKVEFFKQLDNDRDDASVGAKVKELYTDDAGRIKFVYPAGEYVARVADGNGGYSYFWDIEIEDERQEEYDLETGTDWQPGSGQCDAASQFRLILRDMDGEYISGLNYAVYEQSDDADGNPYAVKTVFSGKVDTTGRAVQSFNPDTRKNYVLKIWENNEKIGAFWYYDAFRLSCGDDIDISKSLPALHFILRDGRGELVKNKIFSLYTQKYDADGKPIKEKSDLVYAKYTSSAAGEVTTYLAPAQYGKNGGNGTYVFEAKGTSDRNYVAYGIHVSSGQDTVVEYIFSDILATFKTGRGETLVGEKVEVFIQGSDLKGNRSATDKVSSLKTDNSGSILVEYPATKLVFLLKDDLNQNNYIWNVPMSDRKRTVKEYVLNTTMVNGLAADASSLGKKDRMTIYSMTAASDGVYVRGEKLSAVNFSESGTAELSLAPGPYLFTVTDGKNEFGQALYAVNGKMQTVTVRIHADYKLTAGQKFRLETPTSANSLADRLKGYILLQVEQNGEAWYVRPDDGVRYYMKDGDTAYEMMRRFGLGISNADLKKLPIGINKSFEESDYDGDYVPDKMEEALGTDMYNHDSDGDGYDDGQEAESGFNPLGPGRLNLDLALAAKLKGRIVLQVESRGEAWYVNPADGRRYYMKDGASAYEIMRFLSLGITDENLELIDSDEL